MDPSLKAFLEAEPEASGEVGAAGDKKGNDAVAAAAVLVNSVEMPSSSPTCSGYDFNKGINYDELLQQYQYSGFQATNVGLAINEINRMLAWRLSDEPKGENEEDEDENGDPIDRSKVKCTIFLGYTSNMISCGVREVIRYLCEHKLVDAIVTTGGGIEEDIMKCFNPHYMGDFQLRGKPLRLKGINRIGNLLVPNKNYCDFESWILPILDKLLQEQKEQGTIWTPSKIINRLGKEINNPQSVYYWCYKNNIPVFCPAITDGSVGDMCYFHSFKNPGLIIDIAQDIRLINDIAIDAKKSGIIILGGGVVKHHICNANLFRNGADYSVFINTGQEFDGSDSGAKPEEAISWGKIKINAHPVKVYAEASIVFPLVVAQTFAKEVERRKSGDKSAPIAPSHLISQSFPSSTPAASSSSTQTKKASRSRSQQIGLFVALVGVVALMLGRRR